MKKYLLTSISLHITLLIFAAIFGFWWGTKQNSINKIDVYLEGQKERNFYSKPYPLKKSSLGSDNTNFKTASQIQKNQHAENNSQSSSQLTLFLHNLIQAQIKHPSTISPAFGGHKVYLSFTLFPDGHIENEKILQSSGIALLDQLALEGLSSLPKTTVAQKLLQHPEEFKAPKKFNIMIKFM